MVALWSRSLRRDALLGSRLYTRLRQGPCSPRPLSETLACDYTFFTYVWQWELRAHA